MKTKTVVALCVAIALSIGTFSMLWQAEHRNTAHTPETSLQASTEASTSASADQSATIAATQDELRPADAVTDSTRPIAQPLVSLAQLPSENALLYKGMLDSKRIGIALKRENFANTVTAFEGDSRTDSLAIQMTNAYRTAIEAKLAELSAGGLEHFSCGLSLCVGSIRSMQGAKLPEDWSDRINAGKNLAIYALSQVDVELGKGDGETRFIFSTSQANNGFYIASSP